jgi:glutamate-1-semialdehyde aminotransferase
MHDEHMLEPIHEEINSEAWRSKRQRTIKYFGDDFTVYLMDDTPRNISEASSDVDDWKKAVHSEMNSILSNET